MAEPTVRRRTRASKIDCGAQSGTSGAAGVYRGHRGRVLSLFEGLTFRFGASVSLSLSGGGLHCVPGSSGRRRGGLPQGIAKSDTGFVLAGPLRLVREVNYGQR